MENKKLRVLALEDSPWDLELMKGQLIAAGFIMDFTHVINEADYTAALVENKFDIILSDFYLPGFDAYDALNFAKNVCPEVPFICVSGTMGEEKAIELLKAGAVDYVLKDRPDRLPFAIKRALKEAEEKNAHLMALLNLKESENRFRQVAETAHEWIWEIDTNGLYTYSSPVVFSLLGYYPDEVVGKMHFFDFFEPVKKHKLKKIAFEVISKNKTFRYFENQCIHKDGHVVILSTTGSPFFDDKGNIMGYRGVDEDITIRKQTEWALQAKSENIIKLLEISLILNKSIEKGKVFQNIVNHSVELLGLESGAIYLVNKDELLLEAALPALTPDFPLEFRKAKLENHWHINKAVKTKRIVILTDTSVGELSEHERIIVKANGFKTLIYNPLINEEIVIGVLILGTLNKLHRFSDEEINLCLTLSNLSALALKNALLFENLNQHVFDLQKAMEEKNKVSKDLVASEEKFRTLFENHSAVKLIIDPITGNILEANQAAANFYGWSVGELQKMNITQINTLPSQEIGKEMVNAINLKKNRFQFKHKNANGRIMDVEVFSSSILTGGKQILHSIIHDISEKKQAEMNLLLLNRAIESSSVSVIISDAKGDIIYTNPYFTKLTGYSLEEAMGNNPRIMKSGMQPDVFYQELWRTILSGSNWEGEMLNKKKNGELFWEKAVISPILNSQGEVTHFIAIKDDISYKKQAEQIRQQLEVAQKTARFKQDFLAKMSHEIRTPLTGVLGMIDVLEQTQLTQEQLDFVNNIKISGENLKEIINQVLEYSKIEAGKIALKPSVFAFESLLENAVRLYKDSMNAAVVLHIEVDSQIPPFIIADKFRLSQVLNNLLSNAIKFTHQGSITIKAKLENTGFQGKNLFVKIEVCDTGKGMPLSLQKRLFNPFVQGDDDDSNKCEGTGLGLSICKELAELMQGEIGVDSEQGKGSTFWFTFLTDAAADNTSKKKELPRRNIKKRKLSVLVIEDTIVLQKITKLMLQSMGHEVQLANNGKHAIELFEPGRFDLILMDVQMPVMDGVTATRILREKYTYLPPIVGLSANAFEGDREKYIAAGMDEYLTKPFNKSEFQRIVSCILPSKT